MRIHRSVLASFLASALVLPATAAAHPNESIGFELEDGGFIWPAEEYHQADEEWPTCRTPKYQRNQPVHVDQTVAPTLRYGGDELGHDHHCDLEIELGPYTMANLNHDGTRDGMFTHVQGFMDALDGDGAFSGFTADAVVGAHTYRQIEHLDQLLDGFVANPAHDPPQLGVLNAELAAVPDTTRYRVGRHFLRSPQVTFSLDIRKLVRFFAGAGGEGGEVGRRPYPMLRGTARAAVDRANAFLGDDANLAGPVDEREAIRAMVDDQVVRGFLITSAMYVGDVVRCRTGIQSTGNRGEGCGKASHPLFLRERPVARVINNATNRNDVNGYYAYYFDVRAYVAAHAAMGNNDADLTTRYLGYLRGNLQAVLRDAATQISNTYLPNNAQRAGRRAANLTFVDDYVAYLFTAVGATNVFTTDFADAEHHADYATLDRRGRRSVLESLFANNNKHVFFEERGLRNSLDDPERLAVPANLEELSHDAAAARTFGASATVTIRTVSVVRDWLRSFHGLVNGDIPSQ